MGQKGSKPKRQASDYFHFESPLYDVVPKQQLSNWNHESLRQAMLHSWQDVDMGAAIHLACRKGNYAVLSGLLLHPAVDVNTSYRVYHALQQVFHINFNWEGRTPLEIACFHPEDRADYVACTTHLMLDVRTDTSTFLQSLEQRFTDAKDTIRRANSHAVIYDHGTRLTIIQDGTMIWEVDVEEDMLIPYTHLKNLARIRGGRSSLTNQLAEAWRMMNRMATKRLSYGLAAWMLLIEEGYFRVLPNRDAASRFWSLGIRLPAELKWKLVRFAVSAYPEDASQQDILEIYVYVRWCLYNKRLA